MRRDRASTAPPLPAGNSDAAVAVLLGELRAHGLAKLGWMQSIDVEQALCEYAKYKSRIAEPPKKKTGRVWFRPREAAGGSEEGEAEAEAEAEAPAAAPARAKRARR